MYGGRRTARNEITYAEGGHVYVFFVYGMYYQLNLVTGLVDHPHVVLIRAVEPVEGIELEPQRQGYDVRFGWLQRLLKRPPKPMREFLAGEHYRQREKTLEGDAIESSTIERIFSVRKQLLRWNRKPHRVQPLPIALQQDIRLHLREEVDKLASLIGRDLGHWLQPRVGSKRLASPYE